MTNKCAGKVEIPPNGKCPHCGSGPDQPCGKFEYLSRKEMDARLAEDYPPEAISTHRLGE